MKFSIEVKHEVYEPSRRFFFLCANEIYSSVNELLTAWQDYCSERPHSYVINRNLYYRILCDGEVVVPPTRLMDLIDIPSQQKIFIER